VALRKLDRPQAALDHFMTFYEEVGYPISRARGAYWAGRAAEALGKPEDASIWYDLAADHGNTFYGQLGADKLGVAPRLAPVPEPSQADIDAFAGDELVTLVQQLAEIDARGLVRRFLLQIGENAQSPEMLHLTAQFALVLGRPDLAVAVAKDGVRRGTVLVYAGYPLIDLPPQSRIDPALALAVIRQESSFDPGAVSPAGARGLMQLMPATAAGVAGDLGIAHSQAMLTSDPDHNMRLGTAYLSELLGDQGGSYVRAIAAYNAGPSRIYRWVELYGDPAAPGADVVDWIEQIPYSETRNYVQRVLEALIVYRVLQGIHTARLDEALTDSCALSC
jgi:soluble lytic murein transglycosylase